jgi:uncharacterized protein (TIGR02246 family)
LDAEFTNVFGNDGERRGRGREVSRGRLQDSVEGSKLKTMDVTIRFTRSDVAVVHVTSQINGFLNPNGATEPPHSEVNIRVFQRENGIWRIGASHNTAVASTLNQD